LLSVGADLVLVESKLVAGELCCPDARSGTGSEEVALTVASTVPSMTSLSSCSSSGV
jgi:hypothetical protein